MDNHKIHIEVVYAASPHQNWIIPLEFNSPVDINTAIKKSGILKLCPEINLTINKTGIYGEIVALTHPLKNHDRVEIYRPLEQGPMAKRMERVKKARKHKNG